MGLFFLKRFFHSEVDENLPLPLVEILSNDAPLPPLHDGLGAKAKVGDQSFHPGFTGSIFQML
jgi:hypothetical protein